jgi:hypothetical protein
MRSGGGKFREKRKKANGKEQREIHSSRKREIRE